jgi:hypothetical protein
MPDLSSTIELINQYLRSQLAPVSGLDFFIQYIAPILQLLIIFGGAGAGLYKYYKTKNREIYQQLLSEVYAPLYQYFLKQELIRKLLNIPGDYHETPVLEYNSNKTTTNMMTGSSSTTSASLLGLNRQELIKVLDTINIGLAPRELYTLLSMYKVLVHMGSSTNKSSDPVLTSLIMEINVENKLRREIISGYKKYHEKLGIKAGAQNDFFKLNEDQLLFTIDVSQKEKDDLLALIKLDPGKY